MAAQTTPGSVWKQSQTADPRSKWSVDPADVITTGPDFVLKRSIFSTCHMTSCWAVWTNSRANWAERELPSGFVVIGRLHWFKLMYRMLWGSPEPVQGHQSSDFLSIRPHKIHNNPALFGSSRNSCYRIAWIYCTWHLKSHCNSRTDARFLLFQKLLVVFC